MPIKRSAQSGKFVKGGDAATTVTETNKAARNLNKLIKLFREAFQVTEDTRHVDTDKLKTAAAFIDKIKPPKKPKSK